MSRCVIIGGASINFYDEIRKYLQPDDFFIFCDNGLRHVEGLGAEPDLIIGDFDSHPAPELPVETIFLPRAKDDTDSVYAVREALNRGFDEFLLLGVVGDRIDHSIANISILLKLDSLGKHGMIIDDFSEMEVISRKPGEVGPEFPFFSLLNISGMAGGITIENAKFPLENSEIDCEYQYGVSNEPLPGKTARISVAQGRLLLVKVRRG